MCVPISFAKYLKTKVLENTCKRLFMKKRMKELFCFNLWKYTCVLIQGFLLKNLFLS